MEKRGSTPRRALIELTEVNMELSELKFKVVTGTGFRNRSLVDAVYQKGSMLIHNPDHKMYLAYNATVDGHFREGWVSGSDLGEFVNVIDAPEVTFQQALDLISQVREREPEFPFKPKDWCMATDPGAPYGWKLAIYSNIDDCEFQCIGSYYKRIAPLDEKMLGAIGKPAEWWEIKDGKPKLMRG